MAPRKEKLLSRPCGIYVYCTDSEKDRIKQAAQRARRSLSQYMIMAALAQIEKDEKK